MIVHDQQVVAVMSLTLNKLKLLLLRHGSALAQGARSAAIASVCTQSFNVCWFINIYTAKLL